MIPAPKTIRCGGTASTQPLATKPEARASQRATPPTIHAVRETGLRPSDRALTQTPRKKAVSTNPQMSTKADTEAGEAE